MSSQHFLNDTSVIVNECLLYRIIRLDQHTNPLIHPKCTKSKHSAVVFRLKRTKSYQSNAIHILLHANRHNYTRQPQRIKSYPGLALTSPPPQHLLSFSLTRFISLMHTYSLSLYRSVSIGLDAITKWQFVLVLPPLKENKSFNIVKSSLILLSAVVWWIQ